ncbi:MAG: hypothetical protein R6U51_00365 [Anaerolineales bacterium]
MDEGLGEILAVSGVRGCLLFDNQSKLLRREGAITHSQNEWDGAGEVLVQTLATLESGYKKFTDLEIYFNDRRLVLRDLEKAVLVVICDPELDVALLRLTINVVINRWKENSRIQRFFNDHHTQRRDGQPIFG